MKPTDFYTREKANAGAKLYLMLPDGSISTEHYLIVRGVDSDEYIAAKTSSLRSVMESSTFNDPEMRDEVVRESTRKMYASLIAGWSFEEECTEEAKIEFLRESPNNAKRVDTFASDRNNFFMKESQS